MKTRILVITEHFSHGGLETQIAGQARVLASLGIDLLLATSSPVDNYYHNIFARVLTGLEMGPHVTYDQFSLTLKKLKKFIADEHITMIHAHPFYSAIVGLLAAQQSQLPFVVTIHGPLSLSEDFGPIYNFLIRHAVLPAAGKVYCVSKETELLCRSIAECKTELLPNAVEIPAPSIVKKSGAWLWAGRLDTDKSKGLLDLLEKIDRNDVGELHIFGEGPGYPLIASFLQEYPSKAEFIRIMGWCRDLTAIIPSYAGVAGMGRVMLEGAASNRPCLLVGYDGVKGLLDVSRFELASYWNLSGRGLPTITADTLHAEFRSLSEKENVYLLHRWLAVNRDERLIWKRYAQQIEHLVPLNDPAVQTVLDALQYRGATGDSVWWDEELLRVIWGLFSNLSFGQSRLEKTIHHVFVTHFRSDTEAIKSKASMIQSEIIGLREKLDDCTVQIANLSRMVAERDGQIANLKQMAAERDDQIANLKQMAAERDNQIANLKQMVAERDNQIANLKQMVAERDDQIASLKQMVTERDCRVDLLQKEIHDIWASISWRITRPLRCSKIMVRGCKGKISLALKHVYSVFSKVFYYTKRATYLLMNGGLPALYSAIRYKIIIRNQFNSRTSTDIREKTMESCRRDNHGEPLLADEIAIFAVVPFDDIGGGQRAAQLARCALKTGRRVLYVYVYKKFNFEKHCYVDSVVDIYNLVHIHIDDLPVERFIEMLGEDATVIFELPHPKLLKYLKIARICRIRTVFELIDAWDTSLGGDWFNDAVMQQFIDEADCVIGTAKVLHKMLMERGRADAIYLPNAANEYFFDKYKTYPRPGDMPSNPVGLYFGSLYGEWIAWDYLYTAARENSHINFCLIGDKPNKITDHPKNVLFLGEKRIEELPAYLNSANFCILPFVPGKISDAVSPIKVFEYLFMEKPVISTSLPEVNGYPGVYIAKNPYEFSQLCAEMSNRTHPGTNDLFIASNSWYGRLQYICGAKGENNVTAIILIHNNKTIIERCLSSLIEHCVTYLAEIIVVDNQSTDGGAEFVRARFPQVRVVKNHVNGCSSGRNLGISMASGKYIAFFDSDQWFTSSAGFAEALSILKRDASIGAVSWGAGWFDRNRDDLGGPITDYLPNRGMNQHALKTGYREDVGYLATCGLFAPRSVVQAVGGFDENYDPTCFEDTDLSFAIKNIGLKIVYRDLTGIRHQPHQTTKASSLSESYIKLFKRNAEYFKSKWKDHYEFFLEYKEL